MSESARPGAGNRAGDTGPGSRRWVVLVAGLLAMTAGCTFQYGLAYLIPAFRAEGLSLEQAGILVACPTAGLLLTLVAWGAAADRCGERLVLGAGLALAGTILLAGATVHGTAALGACLAAAGRLRGIGLCRQRAAHPGLVPRPPAGPGHGHPAERPAAGRGRRRARAAVHRRAAATPPVLAAMIGAAGYAVAFGVVALFPLGAAVLVPVGEERRAAARAGTGAAAPDLTAGR